MTTAITDGSREIVLRRGNQSNFADVASLVVAVPRSLNGARSVDVEGNQFQFAVAGPQRCHEPVRVELGNVYVGCFPRFVSAVI